MYGLEDGEIDESHLYNDYDDEYSVDENCYHNYIYNIIEDAANVSIDNFVTEPDTEIEPETDIAFSSCSASANMPCENDDDINEYMLAGHYEDDDEHYHEDDEDEDNNNNRNVRKKCNNFGDYDSYGDNY